MTIGAQALEILVIPIGWTMNRTTRMAQLTPIMVLVVMLELATLRPCTAPRTDWAGVRTPSAMIRLTPNTASTLSKPWMKRLFSRASRRPRLVGRSSELAYRSILIVWRVFGSRFEMLHYVPSQSSVIKRKWSIPYVTWNEVVHCESTSFSPVVS